MITTKAKTGQLDPDSFICHRHGRSEVQLGRPLRPDPNVPIVRSVEGSSPGQAVKVHRDGRRQRRGKMADGQEIG